MEIRHRSVGRRDHRLSLQLRPRRNEAGAGGRRSKPSYPFPACCRPCRWSNPATATSSARSSTKRRTAPRQAARIPTGRANGSASWPRSSRWPSRPVTGRPAERFYSELKDRLEGWLTATDDAGRLKSGGLFYYDKNWGTLIGYPASFGTRRRSERSPLPLRIFLPRCGRDRAARSSVGRPGPIRRRAQAVDSRRGRRAQRPQLPLPAELRSVRRALVGFRQRQVRRRQQQRIVVRGDGRVVRVDPAGRSDRRYANPRRRHRPLHHRNDRHRGSTGSTFPKRTTPPTTRRRWSP